MSTLPLTYFTYALTPSLAVKCSFLPPNVTQHCSDIHDNAELTLMRNHISINSILFDHGKHRCRSFNSPLNVFDWLLLLDRSSCSLTSDQRWVQIRTGSDWIFLKFAGSGLNRTEKIFVFFKCDYSNSIKKSSCDPIL